MVTPPPVESPTLRTLLARTDLRLRIEGEAMPLEHAALARPLRWVHSSDLADPTPFLSEGMLLLTTGTQFEHAEPEAYSAYVRRLRDRGVAGLGFGTEVVREGIPPALVAACREQRMPLFEVPYRTPFIAVARANAEAIAAEAFARRSWALSAQSAVSLAALRHDGLSATLAELARQLDAWVGLFDTTGELRHEHPPGGLSDADRQELGQEVAVVLRRGARAGSSLRTGATPFTVQTLGRGGHLRGVVAIASGDLDPESRGVVTSVIAMAGLALEQSDDLVRARRMLRAAVVHALLAGDTTLARLLTRELGAPWPTGNVEIAVVEGSPVQLERAAESLDARTARAAAFGRGPDGLVLILEPGGDLPDDIALRFGVRVGVSRPSPLTDAAAGHTQAVTALRRQRGAVARFGRTAASGLLGALDSDLARMVAAASLAPLVEHDAAHGSDLVTTVRVWLEHDARIDRAAEALGVHRHTARARLAMAERVLGRDLSTLAARAELWAAFGLVRGP